MKLQHAARSRAGPAHVYCTRAASKVDVVVLQPTAVRSVADVEAAVGVGARFRLQIRDPGVAGGLDLLRSVDDVTRHRRLRAGCSVASLTPSEGSAGKSRQGIAKGTLPPRYLKRLFCR